ncbi:MAG: hypothetical protein V7603_3429 [Micromonosporaceae bacterium]|jgi:TRAP-type uncharacterized transport system fused permease subunit
MRLLRNAMRHLRRPAARMVARLTDDSGMNTAEYAVGTLAAVAFAGLLYKVLTSDGVRSALTSLIERALR